MTINVKQIKKLREQTNAGIADIKEALEKADGDEKKALSLLQQKGLDKAAKRSIKETGCGVIEAYVHSNKNSGAMVVLTCETDFVARNDEFLKLAHEIAMQVCAMEAKDVESLIEQPWIKDEKQKVSDLIQTAIAKFGENIKIKEIGRFQIK